jgi:MFS family permease
MFGLGATFGRVWGAHTANQIAFETAFFVLPVLAATSFNGSPGEIALVSAAITLPSLVLALPAGAWIDRHRRQGVLIASSAARTVMLAGLVAALIAGVGDILTLAVFGFVFASFAMVTDIAALSLLPHVVGHRDLGLANARLEIMRSLAQLLAPAVAGVLITAVAPAMPVAVAALLLVISTVLLARLAVAEPTPEPAPGRLWRDMVDGLRFVLTTPVLRDLSLSACLWTLSGSAMRIAVVVLALTELEVSAASFGYALAAGGAGGLLGGLLAYPLAQRFPLGRVATAGPALGTLGYGTMLLAPDGPTALLVIAVGLFLEGLGSTVWVVSATTLRQRATPLGMLGRLAACIRLIAGSTRPIGAALAGVIAGAFGARAVLILAVVVTMAAVIVLLRSEVTRPSASPPPHQS